MATTSQDLLKELNRFKNTPESKGYELRLGLADIVLRNLEARGWSQRQLAAAAGMKGSFITRIIHANSNRTFSVAGRLLAALGVDADMCERAVPGKSRRKRENITGVVAPRENGPARSKSKRRVKAG